MSGLKRHKQIHSWGKPFECIECGKTVCWSTNLILHSLIHTGQKPYECGACGKAFSCSSSLRHHQRMHSDSSPPSVTEDRRPLTTTHASLTLSELLLGKDSLNVTCEGNFCHKKCLLQDLIIYTKEKLHKSLDCKTNKQTNKQTNPFLSQNTVSSEEQHQQQTQPYFPSENSPRKELQGWGGGRILFYIRTGNLSYISLQVYLVMLSQGLFYKAHADKNEKTGFFRPPCQTYGSP